MDSVLGRVPLEGQAYVSVQLTVSGLNLHFRTIQGVEMDLYLSPPNATALGELLTQAGQRYQEITDTLKHLEDCRKDVNRRENEYLQNWMAL